MAKVNFDIENMSVEKVGMYEAKLFEGKAKRVRYPAPCKRAYAYINLVNLDDAQAKALAKSKVVRMFLSAAVYQKPEQRVFVHRGVFYTRLDHNTWSVVGDIGDMPCVFHSVAQDCSIPA